MSTKTPCTYSRDKNQNHVKFANACILYFLDVTKCGTMELHLARKMCHSKECPNKFAPHMQDKLTIISY